MSSLRGNVRFALCYDLGVLAACLLLTSPAAASAHGGGAARAAKAAVSKGVPDLDPIFAKWNSRDTPGCVVGVEREGREVLVRAYGMADLEAGIPNAADTVFEAGSVSKQFTAAAVLRLVDAGKLRLDTDVRTIIPELPDYGHVITVDNLLNHTSGLRDWGAVVGLAGWPRGTRIFTQNDFLGVVAKQKALNFEPGAESSYTNTGYNLLTEIVRRISGKSLAAFSQEAFFRPLGMTQTQWRDDFRQIVPKRATAYDWTGAGYEQEMPFENTYGNGGLLTTVSDLLVWNRALDSGALGAFVTSKLAERSVLRDGRKLTYGRGLFNYRFQGTEEISHAGSTAGYRAWLGRYPVQHLSVAMLCNASNAETGLARKVASRFLPAAHEAGQSKAPLTGLFVDEATGAPLDSERYQETPSRIVSKDRLELVGRDGNVAVFLRAEPVMPAAVRYSDYIGRYRSDEIGATYVILADGAGLSWRIHDRPDFEEPLKPVYRDGFQSKNAIVRFRRDRSGRVTALTIGVERARNVHFERLP